MLDRNLKQYAKLSPFERETGKVRAHRRGG